MPVPYACVVRVTDGQEYAKRKHPCYTAVLYELGNNSSGETVWLDTKIRTRLRRSVQKAEEDGRLLAEKYHTYVMPGFGSLHNKPLADALYEGVWPLRTCPACRDANS